MVWVVYSPYTSCKGTMNITYVAQTVSVVCTMSLKHCVRMYLHSLVITLK